MEKINLTKNDFKEMEFVSKTNSLVCKKDGIMYKVLNPQKVNLDQAKTRISMADNLNLYHIERPISELYLEDKFVGFTSREEHGILLDDYLCEIIYQNNPNILAVIAYLFKDLETIIKKANEENIVLPDLGSNGNIMVTNHGLKYIDYMGLQIKDERTEDISGMITHDGWSNLFPCHKYFTNEYLYTSELDKASLIYLLFSHIFQINLANLNGLEHYEVVEWICRGLNILDKKFIHKVWALYQNNLNNEFIAEDLERLAKDYKLVCGRRVLVRK